MKRHRSCSRADRGRALLLAVPALIVLAGCNRGIDYGQDAPAPVSTEVPVKTKPPRKPAKQARERLEPVTVRFAVRDQDGHGRSGIPIAYQGTSSGTLVTGSEGRARVAVPPGTYRFRIDAGCARTVEIFKAPPAITLGIAPRTRVDTIEWRVDMRRRYSASGPATWSPEPPWPRGATVRFGFRIYDRCTNKPAPRVSFTQLVYRPQNLELLDTPRASDRDARVEIAFRCTGSGDAALFLEDPANRNDGIDLLSIRSPAFGPTDWCG